MNRPMVWVAGGFALGIALTHALWTHDWWFAVPTAVAAVAWTFAVAKIRGGGTACAVTVLAFILAGGGRYAAARYHRDSDPLRLFLRSCQSETVTVTGSVVTAPLMIAPGRQPQIVIAARTVTVGGETSAVKGKVLVRGRYTELVRPGDTATVTGTVEPPRSFDLKSDPYTGYLDRRGISAVLDVRKHNGFVSSIPAGSGGWRRTLFDTRLHVLHLVSAVMDTRETLFLAAAWLGEKQALSRKTSEALINTGTYHIACVSGIHLAIVAAVAGFFLRSLGFRKRKEAVCTIAVVLLFTVLAGARLPVCRAAFMLIVYYTGRLARREVDGLNTISLAALVLMAVQPLNLLDVGFELSFISVYTLIILRRRGIPRFKPAARFLSRGIRAAFVSSLALFVATLPLVMRTFGVVSFISPIANIFITPLMVPILTLAAISTATGFIWPAAAIVFNGANKLLIMALLAATRFLGSIPGFHIEVPPPPVFSVFLYYAALAVLVAKRRREPSSSRAVTDQTDVHNRRDRTIRMRRRAAVSAIIFALAVLAWALPLDRRPSAAANGSVPFTGDTLRVTVLNVGQGDSILVEFPEGQTMLVDAGPAWREGDAGASIVVPFLRANGIRHLDAVVVTHGHNDHVGGMASVLDMVRTGTVFSTGVPWDIPAYHRFIDVVHNKNIPFKTLVAGDRLDFGDRVVVETLYPEPADIKMYTSNPNDTSLVLKITFGTTRILLTADMTGLVENLLLERGVSVRSDVLKVPHNGSVYSSTPKFLHAASPMLAVLPVGADNRFGFPSAELVDRYRKAGIMLLRTDRDGHIRIDTDGTRIRWTTSTGKTGILRRIADPPVPSVVTHAFD